MKRRNFLKLSTGIAFLPSGSLADTEAREIRIGYQKNGVLVVARQRATLEGHFRPHGIEMNWVEFSSGPPMMGAMSVGSIDFGVVGDSPPVPRRSAPSPVFRSTSRPLPPIVSSSESGP